jgi:hypothetical protein
MMTAEPPRPLKFEPVKADREQEALQSQAGEMGVVSTMPDAVGAYCT